MSDHGDSHSTGGFNYAHLLGKITMIGVPALMIVMLGVSGYAFIKNSGIEAVAEADAAPAKSAAATAPAPKPAPATPATTATATPDAPKAASAGAADIDPAVMTLGQAAYANCLACHGADGKGLQIGALSMAPALAGSEVLLADPNRPLLVVLKGIAKETNDYLGIMAPLGAALDDEKLAAVLTYVRNSFGNSAPAVTVEQAAAARAKFSEVPMMVSRLKIEEILKAHP